MERRSFVSLLGGAAAGLIFVPKYERWFAPIAPKVVTIDGLTYVVEGIRCGVPNGMSPLMTTLKLVSVEGKKGDYLGVRRELNVEMYGSAHVNLGDSVNVDFRDAVNTGKIMDKNVKSINLTRDVIEHRNGHPLYVREWSSEGTIALPIKNQILNVGEAELKNAGAKYDSNGKLTRYLALRRTGD